jgi:AmpD protein
MGQTNWNGFSYGIELLGHGTSGFTEAQYKSCAMRCAALISEYNIPSDMIVGHETISPGRKFDPGIASGNFDMAKLRKLINGYI